MNSERAPGSPTDGAPPGPPSTAPPFRHILLSVDLRDPRSPIPRAAAAAVLALGSEFTLCHVEMRSTSLAGNEADGSPASAEEVAMVGRLRTAATEAFGPGGRAPPVKILHGDPGERICEFADFLGCDLIVLGPRPKSSIAKVLRGSVSKYVVANSRRNVLVLGD